MCKDQAFPAMLSLLPIHSTVNVDWKLTVYSQSIAGTPPSDLSSRVPG